jgi:hypothetical protein
MGWSSGSQLADDVYELVSKYIPEEDKKKVAKKMYDLFCNHDADDWCDSQLKKDAFQKSKPKKILLI